MNYQHILQEVLESTSTATGGQVADYIPELAHVDASKFGIALRTVGGETFAVGDAQERFSIQSIAKVFALSQAITLDREALRERVGVEPSGDPFNSLVQLEYEGGRPRNPLINAGALVVCDILVERLADPKAELLEFVRNISGLPSIGFDEAVADSERRTTFRNRAHLNLMKSFGNIRGDVEAVIDFYVHLCSLSMSCEELVQAFLFLADHGRCLAMGKNVLGSREVKRLNAVMLTCGFYDEAGEFAFNVGLPGKSGVGGGIAAVCPEQFAVAVWSPPLNKKGNSVRGTLALAELARRTNSSIF
ncbi:MAG: glutaminase [Myxococcota bacterium]